MLCQDCQRGMIYCGSCDEEEYFRFHEYKEADCFDCEGKGWIVTTGVNNLPEQETCQVCNGEKTLMYSKEEFVKLVTGQEIPKYLESILEKRANKISIPRFHGRTEMERGVKHPDGTNYDVSLKDLEVSHD